MPSLVESAGTCDCSVALSTFGRRTTSSTTHCTRTAASTRERTSCFAPISTRTLARLLYSTSSSAASVRAEHVRLEVLQNLRTNGWARDRCSVIVIAPELETWLWQDNAHVAQAIGFTGPSLRQHLQQVGKWPVGAAKPLEPKKAIQEFIKGHKKLKTKVVLLPHRPLGLRGGMLPTRPFGCSRGRSAVGSPRGAQRMRTKAVPSHWLRRGGHRLDVGPYLSGALEVKVRLEELRGPQGPA